MSESCLGIIHQEIKGHPYGTVDIREGIFALPKYLKGSTISGYSNFNQSEIDQIKEKQEAYGTAFDRIYVSDARYTLDLYGNLHPVYSSASRIAVVVRAIDAKKSLSDAKIKLANYYHEHFSFVEDDRNWDVQISLKTFPDDITLKKKLEILLEEEKGITVID
jgi:hypothetical protein